MDMPDEKRNLLLFFLVAFAWSWLLWLPEVLWNFRLYLAPFGPTVSAFILTYANDGLNGVKELLKRGIDFRFKKIWWIPIFFLMPAIVGFSLLLSILSGSYAEIAILFQPLIIIPAFFYIFVFGRSFGGRIWLERICS